MGLYLYPEGGGSPHQFEQDPAWDGDPNPLNPHHNRSPDSVSGTPQDDLITFAWNTKYLYLDVHSSWQSALAYGVKQQRLLTGEIVLEVKRGAAGGIVRACWDVCDQTTGVKYKETATGVVSMEATVGNNEEQWTMTLHRGDYLLRNGVLEASTRGCGGA